MTKRVLLLISDTGGGHRSACNAIVAALDEVDTGPEAGKLSGSNTVSKTSHRTAAFHSLSWGPRIVRPFVLLRRSMERSITRRTAAAASAA